MSFIKLIKIEEPYIPITISQYFNCQQYGYTRAYCSYQARCVRWGSDHQSSDCPNSRNVPTKCALCYQNQSNYKGCAIYKTSTINLLTSKKVISIKNFMNKNTKSKFGNLQGSHINNQSFSSQHISQIQTTRMWRLMPRPTIQYFPLLILRLLI